MLQKPLFISIGVIGVIFIILMVLLSRGGGQLDSLQKEMAKIEQELRAAQLKFKKEKEKLASLTIGLQSSFPGAWIMQEQMKLAAEAIGETDFMFMEANGENPETLFNNPLSGIFLDEERREITLILFRWQKLREISGLEAIDLKEAEKIKKEIESIKTFIENLSKVVESLTPETSGISQFQIDIFQTGLPPRDVLEEALVAIEEIIEESEGEGIVTAGSENSNFPSFDSSPPAVTPAEVVTQQEVVAEEEENVNTLEEQLAEVQEAIQATSSPPPAPLPPTYVPVPPTQSTNNNNNNSNYEPYPEYNYDRTVDTNQGIIIQEGEPRLIQGTDPY